MHLVNGKEPRRRGARIFRDEEGAAEPARAQQREDRPIVIHEPVVERQQRGIGRQRRVAARRRFERGLIDDRVVLLEPVELLRKKLRRQRANVRK